MLAAADGVLGGVLEGVVDHEGVVLGEAPWLKLVVLEGVVDHVGVLLGEAPRLKLAVRD